MSNTTEKDPRKGFAVRFLPLLLGLAMFIVYWMTLNHWVTVANIEEVASVSGWNWQPEIYNPLTFLVTLPFRWLPAAQIPLALNLFAAVCAAATLAVLARTVAILPHDRTEMERLRERGDFSFLTGWIAWLPPIAAVIFAGLELGFWESATNFTAESFELLWFAAILWQLLEFRLDENEMRLYLAAVLYGAGLTENWAMVGFFPLFVMMIIWLRGLDFFRLHFVVRFVVCGFIGLLLILLLPLLAHFSASFPVPIWQALKLNLRTDWQVVNLLGREDMRHDLALMALTSLLPAFAIAIRWSPSFGDSSRLGASLVNYMMHVVNMILLVVMVWVSLDPPFSPRQIIQGIGMSSPPAGLTFYYIVALCIGYYTGYFLLIFNREAAATRRNPRPERALPGQLRWFCPVIVGGLIVSVSFCAYLLIHKNTPLVRDFNDDALLKYATFTAEKLPPQGAILLCDMDESGALRCFLTQAVLARENRAALYPVVNTSSLIWPAYHQYLHRRFPKAWPETVTTNDVGILGPLRILAMLDQLSRSNNLCYLHPSFGYYFEHFYQQPDGLIYPLKKIPENTLLPPVLDKEQAAENESFWTNVLAASREQIDRAQNPPDLGNQSGFVGYFIEHLHALAEPSPNALIVGSYYSRALNCLGVDVQRAGDLDKAAGLFGAAAELNTNNIAAVRNLAFNKLLRSGSPSTVNLRPVTADDFGKYRNWNEVMTANGPFDETSFCFDNGFWLMNAGLLHQSAVAFDRVRQLAPDDLATRLFLAQIYLMFRLPDPALEVLHDPLTRPFRFGLTEFNSTELNILAATADFQKHENAAAAALLQREMDRHPDNEMLMLVSAQTFNRAGLYKDALQAIDRKLARTPGDLTWVYGKGMVCLQAGDYDGAVTALTQFLHSQTNNPDALFNRAVAYYHSDRLNSARADFQTLQSMYTNNFQVAFGLGEIAWKEHQTNDAIRNYRIYLANAPTNSAELNEVRQKVTQLDGK